MPPARTAAVPVANDGVLIAENAPGLSPRGRDFPRRNRLISGMSLAVLVVEAAIRSGSRITADFAKEQGRMIFAVPGNPLDLRAGGTNQLIKEGARLVTEADDVFAGLGPLPMKALLFERAATAIDDRAPLPPTAIAETDRSRIVEALGPAPIGFDDLARAAQVTASQLRVALIELELAGQVERLGGMRVALKS